MSDSDVADAKKAATMAIERDANTAQRGKTMTQDELNKILADHAAWLADNSKGKRADLSGADLRNAQFAHADLRGANLSGANLIGVNFAVPIYGMPI